MMLARDGHQVTVLERDQHEPPDSAEEAVEAWDRPGVAQFKQAHYMHARFRHVVTKELPDVADAILGMGGLKYDTLKELLPPTITDRSPREGDDNYWCLTARRQVLEASFSQCAANESGVTVRRGVHVTGLVKGADAIDGVPNIVGATTADGEELRADIVIDAMGRRSMLNEWIPALGGRAPHEEAEDSGYAYYGQYFRSRDGKLPEMVDRPLFELGSISVLTLPADNDTWVIVVFGASGDQPLKQLRHPDKWEKVVASVGSKAHWLDGEPLGIDTMAGIMDRYRRFVVDDVPIATGILPVADAWACTNPSLGRGISLGMWHASLLRDVLHDANGDPGALAREWDRVTDTTVTPWYQAQVNMDRARVADMDAAREAREREADPMAQMFEAFFTAIEYDPDCFRGFLEIMGCLATPEEILARPGMFEKMIAAADGKKPAPKPGPSREELLAILA